MNAKKGGKRIIQDPQQPLKKFCQEYNFKIALSSADKKKVYALRHKVFCQELQYDLTKDNKYDLEHDIYDDHSLHFFIEHARTGLVAGCLRLVMPLSINSDLKHIPLEEYIKKDNYISNLNPENIPRDKICEVSRLAISPIFRKKNAELENEDYNVFTLKEKKIFSYMIIGLLLSTYALVDLTNRRHVFAFMEPQLPRLISKFGLVFKKVSNPMNIYGNRQVYYFDQKEAEHGVRNSLNLLKMPYEYIRRELAPQLDIISKTTPLLTGAKPSLPLLDEIFT